MNIAIEKNIGKIKMDKTYNHKDIESYVQKWNAILREVREALIHQPGLDEVDPRQAGLLLLWWKFMVIDQVHCNILELHVHEGSGPQGLIVTRWRLKHHV